MWFTVGLVLVFALFIRLYSSLWLKPRATRIKLSNQGIKGPKPAFLLGNVAEMRRFQSKLPKSELKQGQVSHDWASKSLFPFFSLWSQKYGNTFVFSLGNIQVLYVSDHELVKEINQNTSLDLGKPKYLQKERGPLLGQGILTSNGQLWAYQRKIMTPELYKEKIKGMCELMVESVAWLVEEWGTKIQAEGGAADIRIDEDLRSFSGDVISKACFGSCYAGGREIFLRLRALQHQIASKALLMGFPGLKYLPIKSNREIWRLEKEIFQLIMKLAEDRKKEQHERDLLQIIIEGAKSSDLSSEAMAKFIVDNCKNVYLAGHETTAMSAGWTLLLLANHPEWQARVRDEILQVTEGRNPDFDMLHKMKLLTMVIQEALRLYPTVIFMSREALEDINVGNIQVPKGVNIWIPVVNLQRDTTVWGADANEFNPERFANGVNNSCKVPQLYLPFGAGPRICPGINLAMTEIKILLCILLTKFSFSVSPNYRHSPVFKLVLEPENGINVIMKKL
ncbi:Cytochrome P450 [Quillaja saponaria]|uniref:Cytochrome P450 n=1 Tax=Quillaja saponaria TaxID=32244 RepID=A0AAD7PFA5_QUISA|nr:Cytochrome P450 [Quillaja saponaria]WEU75106.1 CYP714E52 [Quillaja saponaria]